MVMMTVEITGLNLFIYSECGQTNTLETSEAQSATLPPMII